MAAKAKARKPDPMREAAADYFAGRSHDAWRAEFLKNNPKERGLPRMRQRGGVMVDVNQPWSNLHPKAKADNKIAAYDAYDAVKKFPNDREAASSYVHDRWIARNKKDPSQPKELFKPYAALPKVEKDKDRAHVDNMKKALAAVSQAPAKKAPRKTAKKAKKLAGARAVRVDAKTWARLEAAARDMSKLSGRKVAPEALVNAALEAFASVLRAVAADARSKKS
jgi:hypothetical protein